MAKAKKENMNIGGSLAELVAQYDQEFMESLPKLYKKKEEREIVEAIVIPHFRAELAKVLTDFQEQRKDAELPVLPDEVPALCEAIDTMVEANKVPLLVDEYFGKGLAWINKMREEAKEQLNEVFYAHCREVLAEKGIWDRKALLQKGPVWFMKKTYSPYGKGAAFAKLILGCSIGYITVEKLNEVATTLELPDIDESVLNEEREKQREVLKQKGIMDGRTLLQKGSLWFYKGTFPPYGKGAAFAKSILGYSVGAAITLSTLTEICNILELPDTNESILEEERQRQREVLANHGITSRRALLQKGPVEFKKEVFIPYGKGSAFAGAILGQSVSNISKKTLSEIADILELPDIDESVLQEEHQKQREVLAEHGVTDRRTLLLKGPQWFREETFPPYGKGGAFAGAIVQSRIPHSAITTNFLSKIAGILELPDTDESVLQEEHQKQREVLAEHGVTDRRTLLLKGSEWFRKETFLPYGKGGAFAGAILGYVVEYPSIEVINKIADILELPDTNESVLNGEHQRQREVLVNHGITSRRALLQKGPVEFKKEVFIPYGKGSAFAKAILGRPPGYLSLEILNEIADVLELPD